MIVEFAGEFTTVATLVGLAATVKSGAGVTESVMRTEWDTEPLVPVTFTLWFPTDPAQDRIDELGPTTLAGVKLQPRLVEDNVDERVTVPENPFTAPIEIVELTEIPLVVVSAVELAEMVKSCMLKPTLVEWDNEPLVPLTCTT